MQAKLSAIAVALLGLAVSVQANAASTLDTVKARGHLICGVNTAAPVFLLKRS